MIRFCMKRVKKTEYFEITDRENTLFFDEYKNNGVLAVYDREKLKGIVTYALYCNESARIQEERVFMNQNVFEQAHMIFNKNKELVLLPVINDGDILCFCYDNAKASYQYFTINMILDYYEMGDNVFCLQEQYEGIKRVRLIGFNEWTYRVYRILKKEEVPIDVNGVLWDYVNINSDEGYVADHEIFTVYGEGTGSLYQSDVYGQFSFLCKIAYARKIALEYRLKEEYRPRFENFYVCLVPRSTELNRMSMDEQIRVKLGVCCADIERNMTLPHNEIYMRQFEKVSGFSPEQWIERSKEDQEKLNDSIISINGIEALKMGDGENTIYLMGPCVVAGMGVMFNDSLASYLYSYICRENLNYSLITLVSESWNCSYFLDCMRSISIKRNDIIIVIEQNENALYKSDIDLLQVFNDRGKDASWFYNSPIHTNKFGNMAIADCICREIIQKSSLLDNDYLVQKGEYLDEQSKASVAEYICSIKRKCADIPEEAKKGAIIMNCNPFTLGHRHLIEYAAKKVDFLYIFILEEDRSFFTFDERYKLVQEGTKDLKNVRVFPSGDFIISVKTFPSYFQKETYHDVYNDACKDVQIFADYIVPGLNIKARFVGEEPLDETTRKYNKILHKILENTGVEVWEIPRFEINGNVISASRVRKYYEQSRWDVIKQMVPEHVYRYLKSRKSG